MTKQELLTLVATSLMQRPELIVTSSTSTTFGVVDDAFILAHQDIQVRNDFRCMEKSTSSPLSYTVDDVDGISVPRDFKKGKYLWFVDPTSGLRQGPFLPDTEDGANLQLAHHLPLHYGSGRIDSECSHQFSGCNNIGQRWYEKNLRIVLLEARDVDVILDYYAFLPAPTNNSEFNYFTKFLFMLLAEGTAYMAFGMLGDTDREAQFLQRYEARLAQYVDNDKQSKMGGTSEVYRPPLVTERVR